MSWQDLVRKSQDLVRKSQVHVRKSRCRLSCNPVEGERVFPSRPSMERRSNEIAHGINGSSETDYKLVLKRSVNAVAKMIKLLLLL